MEIYQNTLFLTTPGLYISRDHQTIRIELDRELKLAVPIHHLESVCIFGPIMLTPQVLQLCWESSVGVNYFSENGYFLGRWEGVHNTSVLLRRAQYRAADMPEKKNAIARSIVAGKIQNARQSLLRSARECDNDDDKSKLQGKEEELTKLLRLLKDADNIDTIRGHEGMAAAHYFAVFSRHLKQQRSDFDFVKRTRRPPLDRINCLLSFLYAVLTHDCIAALTSVGLDSYVGYLHEDRSNRPGLALDLMEEFRPLIADRLAITMINRKQISAEDMVVREGGAVELTDKGRKNIITAYQLRKQDEITHPLLEQKCRVGHIYIIQARILARHLRGDIPEYVPCILK